MFSGPKWPKNGHRNGKMEPQNGIFVDFSILAAVFSAVSGLRPFPFCFLFSRDFVSGWFPILYMAASIATLKDPYRANGRSRFGGQTAGGHPKAFPRPRQPLIALPALRELKS